MPLDFVVKKNIRAYLFRTWSVSWPMVLIMFFEFLIGLTDVYIAGKVGKDIQATYGLVIQLYFIFIIMANALTVGTVSVVSRLFTSEDEAGLTEAIFSSLVSSAGAGMAIAAVSFFFAPDLIRISNIPGDLKPLAVPLIEIYAAGLVFHYVLINSNGVLGSCNRVTVSLRSMATVCGLNITLNFLLVFHTALSYRGIALATASSVFSGGLLNLIQVRKNLRKRRFYFSHVKKMIGIGWPMGLLQICWLLASMALFFILSALPENRVEVLAAFTTGLRIESAIYLPAFAFNMANAVIIGNFLGERKPNDAFGSGVVTATIGVGVITLMAVAVIVSARWIAPFLSDDSVVVRESIKYLYISMMSEPFMAWGMILAGGLSGAGDTKSVLLRVSLSLWLVRIPLSYLFVILLGWGATWVWWSMNLSQIVQALWISKRYFTKRWLPA